MKQVTMYGTSACPYCASADQLLQGKGVQVNKIMVDADPAEMVNMMHRSGRRSVPQIFVEDVYIGGFDDLSALDSAGNFLPLLG